LTNARNERGNEEIAAMPLLKIVINKSRGGAFCVSHKAFVRLRELGQREALQEHDVAAYWPIGVRPDDASLNKFGVLIPRDDQKLVQVVEELRSAANGHCAELKVVEIPSEIRWTIERTEGAEHVSEAHRQWE
jgi:hypothetical protein